MKVGDLVELDTSRIWNMDDKSKVGVVLSISEPTPSNPLELAIVQFSDERSQHRTRYLKVISEGEAK